MSALSPFEFFQHSEDFTYRRQGNDEYLHISGLHLRYPYLVDSKDTTIVGWLHDYEARNIEVLIEGCPKCQTPRQWVNIETLELAEGVIQCEYCEIMLQPYTPKKEVTQ